jgi:hypothetical protein
MRVQGVKLGSPSGGVLDSQTVNVVSAGGAGYDGNELSFGPERRVALDRRLLMVSLTTTDIAGRPDTRWPKKFAEAS